VFRLLSEYLDQQLSCRVPCENVFSVVLKLIHARVSIDCSLKRSSLRDTLLQHVTSESSFSRFAAVVKIFETFR
jgi:hypothetical protein